MGKHKRRTGIRFAGKGSWQPYLSCFAVLALLAQLMLVANHIHLPGMHHEHHAGAGAITSPRSKRSARRSIA